MKNKKSNFFELYYLLLKSSIITLILLLIKTTLLFSQNFTSGDNDAKLYGIHEVTLSGAGLPVTSKRYSIFPNVRFVNGEKTINVKAFYDGDGSGGDGTLWKARLYITKEGSWSWTVTDKNGILLSGDTSGSFNVLDTNFALKGKLRKHTDNANRWATERNTDNAFLALGDTQYTLMDKVWTSEPDSSKGGAGDWDAVIDDSFDNGATLIRAGAFGGYSGWNGSAVVGPYSYPRPNWPFKEQLMRGNKNEYDLDQMITTDTRLQYAINTYPGLYFELIISPKTEYWARYFDGTDGVLDDGRGLDSTEKINLWTYTVARFSAYPNVIFQIVYDIPYQNPNKPDSSGANKALAEEWLNWLHNNDPFGTMRCIGNGNGIYGEVADDPFTEEFYNDPDRDNFYIHDEAISDISGNTADKYYGIKKVPIFHGEDTYEVDDIWWGGDAFTPSDNNPEYYYRRIFWADLLSGAYPAYGGGYKAIVPYSKAFEEVSYKTGSKTIKTRLRGLNDVIHIKTFFRDNALNIGDFDPADSMAIDGPSSPSQIQIAYNSIEDKYIIYHPNATSGEVDYDPSRFHSDVNGHDNKKRFETHVACSINSNVTATVTLKINNETCYTVKWFDPSTGLYYNQSAIKGAGVNYTFIAPSALNGKDAVLLLEGKQADAGLAIMAHRGGKLWAPENTLAAFKKCAENDMDWETDLNLTADGEIVLMHDKTLDRTTNAETVFGRTNIQVNSKTLAQIKKLDAGSYFGSEYAGEKVPTLDEFLDYFVANAPGNSVISMDTKLDELSPDPAVYQSIIDKIAVRNLFDRVFIEVFAVDRVNNTRILNNGDKLKYAIWVGRDTTLLNNAISSGYFSRIHASGKIAYKADDVHAGGTHYFSSHPVDRQTDWDAVKDYNIDGVSTDRPDVALYVIKNEIPICSIKIPVNGSTFNKGSTITIEADVGNSDSSITKVEFYKNGSLIGLDTSRPYKTSWSDVTVGSYSLTAKVFDNGMNKISAPVHINVK